MIVHKLVNNNYTVMLDRSRQVIVVNNIKHLVTGEVDMVVFGFDAECRHFWQILKELHKEGTLDKFIGDYVFND